jgi:hypothetical protein
MAKEPTGIPGLGEVPRRTQKHRGVTVMAAGMHQARRLGGMGQIGRFLDRQRVHVGAKPDHVDLALAGLLALDDADDAGAAEAGGDLVAAEFAQAIGDKCGSAMDVVEQFGVFMDIAAPGLNIGLQIGDAVDDGHGNSGLKGWNAKASVACKGRSTQHSAAEPHSSGSLADQAEKPGEALAGHSSAVTKLDDVSTRPAFAVLKHGRVSRRASSGTRTPAEAQADR